MTKILHIITLLCWSVFAVNVANAQIELPKVIDLDNPEDQKICNQRIKETIRDLYVHLSIMTGSKDSRGKTINHRDRMEAKKRALKLFVNNGNPVQLINDSVPVRLSSKFKRSAQVSVTSLNRKKRNPPKPVSAYFDSQIYLRENVYDEIKIEIIGDSITISPIEKVSKGAYRCTATYTQGYQGYQGWRKEKKAKAFYADKTSKTIDVWITLDSDDPIKLFDIEAKETVKYE